MYSAIFPVQHSMPLPQSGNGIARSAAAVVVIGLALSGTGSVFDLHRANEWDRMLTSRVPFFDVRAIESADTQRPDIRSASEHLANIRQVFNPAIADLATVFGVSRQAIYKWLGGATPEDEKLERIHSLSLSADAFQKAGVTRASSFLKMKAFEGRSLMDLLAAGQLSHEHTQLLIAEAQAMDTAYDRSGLAKSKAMPSDNWRTELSIPGFPE
jgi:transcriptional regulator with XRE-family HTH domain